ncbi:hypothetical protein GCM10010402_14600 [Actinomadura luteofluorescens]|uniref:DUF4132 domain-containing protein n=1 Tax=Actinomadura luteofluorescens TaxID=46163 RepID=UPI002164C237|nr:DUF4132 domain-containing protein [Actinomadura glauciflava]MCR3745780.1 protein of unknown function (DUF4132) [Actinomadura glauciflava]
MVDHPPVLRDENVLVIPDPWLEHLIPRRGGLVPMPGTEPRAEAHATVRENLEAARTVVRDVLEHPGTVAELAEAGLAYLKDEATPLGAAVVARVETMARLKSRYADDADWTDFLVVEHGLSFAARTFAEIEGIWVWGDGGMTVDDEDPGYVLRGTDDLVHAHWVPRDAGLRMRALLAVADDDARAAAVEALAGLRTDPVKRLITSFLMPERTDWVDESCEEPPRRQNYTTSAGARLLWWSLSTAEQVERLGDWAVLGSGEWSPDVLYTVVDGLGEAAAPVLARSLDGDAEPKDRRRIVDALARIPGDEAFQIMGGRLDKVNVLPAMEAMIERFPVRALRILPELTTGTSKRSALAAGLLNAHLEARPGLVETVELNARTRAALDALRAKRAAEAPEDKVPKTLRKGAKKGAPEWAPPAAMPQILLRGREHALPAAATGHLVEELGKASPRRAPAQRLKDALDALDPGSLAEFGWSLFERWRVSGEATRIGWALAQLSWTGDDETARRLGGMARSWPGQDGIQLPLKALDVLAGIGTDVAVMQLHLVAEKARPKRLKKKAGRLLREVADDRGLTMDQLGDRIVPDFGLDADGGMTLDYGPRSFRVGFDERLKPVVFDGKGTLRKSLPKPGAKDDPEAAPAAHRAFTGLKKDVRTVAADQILRMERAMAEQRRWTTEDFRRLFVRHPLLWHLVRRMVWLHDGDGTTAFRIAEDRTFADVNDEALTLPESGEVRIAHPVHLGVRVTAWSKVFADYEILQPFPQLGRPVHAFTDEERAGNRLDRVVDIEVGVGKVLGLERRGWTRGTPEDAGVQHCLVRPVAGRTVVLDVSPGFPVMSPAEWPEQTLGLVSIAESKASDLRASEATFGELDDVDASELLLTLQMLADSADAT